MKRKNIIVGGYIVTSNIHKGQNIFLHKPIFRGIFMDAVVTECFSGMPVGVAIILGYQRFAHGWNTICFNDDRRDRVVSLFDFMGLFIELGRIVGFINKTYTGRGVVIA